MCVAHIATDAQIMRGLGGVDATVAMVRSRKGKGYAPRFVEALVRNAAAVLADGAPDTATFEAALAAEPGKPRRLAGAEAESAIRAVGEYADLKSGYFRGHSAGVAALAAGAARRLRFSDGNVQAVERAGHLHDLGRASVLVDVWEKKGPLTEGERERVRGHATDTERILARAAFLGPAAAIASQDHERLDKAAAYHRHLPARGAAGDGARAGGRRRLPCAPRAAPAPAPRAKPTRPRIELRHEARSASLDAEAGQRPCSGPRARRRAPHRARAA